MRPVVPLLLPLLLVSLLALQAPAGDDLAELSPRQILDRVDDLFRGESSRGRMTMTVTTEHWTRTLAIDFWSKGTERSLLRIRSPRKERGTSTLKSGNDIWNYLPKVRRVIKLPSSMMSASWMGSHFTNDDLVKETRLADDYEYALSFQGERDGQQVLDISATPLKDSAVVWGKVVATVRRADYLPLYSLYYDEDMAVARTLTFSEVREQGGRRIPVRVRIQPAERPDESTEMVYQEIVFDEPMDDDFFSLAKLQRP